MLPAVFLLVALTYYFFFLPVVEVQTVRRGTAISAVYGTVRIEPAFVIQVRAQNSGYISLSDALSIGRGAIGKTVAKGDLLATIADEATARQLKQAQADLGAALERSQIPTASAEPLKVAEANVQRLEKLAALSNVPVVELERAKSEAARLGAAVRTEEIERERNLGELREAVKKLEDQMSSSEIRAPIDGILSDLRVLDGELVSSGNPLLTVSSRKNYIAGEVNEEDVGEVKSGMKANVQLYAYRSRTLTAVVTSIMPAADPETQRYSIVLELQDPPDNLMAGMTGEMNIITGTREKALLVPSRALLVDRVVVIHNGLVEFRSVEIGYRTLEKSEVRKGLKEGELVAVEDQDKLHAGQPVRTRRASDDAMQ